MLLSLLSQMRAIQMRNTAEMNLMNISNSRMGMINSMPSFGGNMGALHSADTRMDMEMAKNSTLYKMACAQEEALNKRLQQEVKKSFDIFA